MHLTTHFTQRELTFSATAERLWIDNTIPKELFPNLMKLAEGMEQVRGLPVFRGMPIQIHSGYRSPMLNKAVKGAKNSAHLSAYAADFTSNAAAPKEIVKAIVGSAIDFDQVIFEGTWVHISFAPAMRHEVLTAHFGTKGTTYTEGIS